MRKLPEVQEAKELMNAAMDWSALKWLFEKPKVRETADRANGALDRLERSVKQRWSAEDKAAYKSVSAKPSGHGRHTEEAVPESGALDQRIPVLEKVLEAHAAARRARADAEETFDEAERQMSTSLAREGCKKAIHSWELHEKAIRKAEAVAEEAQAQDEKYGNAVK